MKVDVAVLGAGALGLSVALHCALRGRSVAVVDRAAAGSQASGRAAGLFKSVQADEARTWLARRSIDKVSHFEDWAGVPLETQRSGSFLVARTPGHKAALQSELVNSRSWGVELREASTAELAESAAWYRPGGSELAVWCPEDIYIAEPGDLIEAYASACRRHGVQILESEAATQVLVPGGTVTGLETETRRIEADAIVDAAGAWVRQVGELAGTRVAIAPVRHQLLITEPSGEVRPTDPIIRVIDAATYVRPARSGLMFGAFEPDPLPIDPRQQPPAFSTDDVPLDLGQLRRLADQVSAEIPQAAQAQVADHRGGLFTMSPDGRFLIGPAPDAPGLWIASGCNGSGFSSSPAIGEVLAAWITDGNPPAGDIAAFSPGRFGPLTDQALIDNGTWQYAHYYDPAPGQ